MASLNLSITTNFQKNKKLVFSDQAKDTFKLASDTELTATLLGYSLHKQVYAPCQLDISMQISGTDGTADYPELISGLDKASVKLTCSADTKKAVAADYYIYKMNSRIVKHKTKVSGETQEEIDIFLDLVAYSKDHLLTLENGSQAFTAKKFIEEIFWGDNEKICEKLNVAIDKATHAQCLTVVTKTASKQSTKTDGSTNTDGDTTVSTNQGNDNSGTNDTAKTETQEIEVIQPYLVQYDEPYYNFLARTANRCGELMYFEDGKLCIGLRAVPGELEAKTLPEPTTISFVNLSKVDPLFASVYFDTVNDAKVVATYPQNLSVMDNVATDEYMFKIKQGEWKTFQKMYNDKWTKRVVGYISTFLSNNGLVDMVGKCGAREAYAALEAKISVEEINKENDELYFNPTKAEQRTSDGTQAYPFTSAFNNDSLHPDINIPYLPTHDFYAKILEYERQVSSQAIELDFGTSYQHILLGDVIKLEGQEYLVTDIKAAVSIGSSTSENYKLTAIPLYAINIKDATKATPKYYAFPPLYAGGHVRKSGVQRAYIYENDDPKRLGRVRIRYPWQKNVQELGSEAKNGEGKDQNRATSSPWVRFSSDYTVDGGGICFHNLKGTEVLIDYENGNVEHPYVIGALYNAKNKATGSSEEHVISSKHGHSIKFLDPSDRGNFVSGLWGGWDLLTTYMPSLANESDNMSANLDALTGGIELKDTYGLYKISMSSDERAIKIASPFGTVDISAFSGITIKAPNGDINITGKNVNITANNNLNITSGKNIKKKADDMLWHSDNKGELAKSAGITAAKSLWNNIVKEKWLAPCIDLSLLRNIYEAVVKPVEGTLKIKSFRYLMLEAGKGAAEIPMRSYDKPNIDQDLISLAAVIKEVPRISAEAQGLPAKLKGLYDTTKVQRTALFNGLRTKIFKDANFATAFTDAEINDKLDKALKKSLTEPDYGHIRGNEAEKKAIHDLWKRLKALAKGFYDADKDGNCISNCTTFKQGHPFLDDIDVVSDKIIKYNQEEIKKYISKSGVLKGDITKTNWGDFVHSVELRDPSLPKKALTALQEDLWDSLLGVSSLAEAKSVFNPYVWTKNSKGEILFSNDRASTISFDKGRLQSKANISVDGLVEAIKNSLNDIK